MLTLQREWNALKEWHESECKRYEAMRDKAKNLSEGMAIESSLNIHIRALHRMQANEPTIIEEGGRQIEVTEEEDIKDSTTLVITIRENLKATHKIKTTVEEGTPGDMHLTGFTGSKAVPMTNSEIANEAEMASEIVDNFLSKLQKRT